MPDQIDILVGHNLRARRREVGLTQLQLAHALGISFQQVQKYEPGANRIAASRLWRASQVLALPVGCFFLEPEPTRIRATDGRPDDPYNGQRPVSEIIRPGKEPCNAS